MPDDYWLHVRGCDCAYCAWERSNAGVAACELGRPWEPVSYGPGCWAVGRRVGNAIERHNLQAPYMTHSEALSIASGLNAGVSPSASRTNDDHTPTGKDQ